MTATAPVSPAAAEAAQRLGAADPEWLRRAREHALSRWEAAPLPDRVDHLWRYTDPSRILPGARDFAVPLPAFGDVPEDFQDACFDKASAYAVARDGVLLRSAVDPMLADLGVVVDDLRRATSVRRSLVEPRLFSLRAVCDGSGASFDDLTAATFAGGAFVHLPRGVMLERPIRIASRIGGASALSARSLFLADEGVRATIVVDLTSASPDDATLLHESTEIFVGRGARLRVVFVEALGRRAVHAPSVRARIERDGSLETVVVALGGATVKSLHASELAEQGARTRVLGLVFGDGRQHFDHHTFQDHVASHTTSDLDFRTVVGGRARSAYTGRLRIRSEALHCEAHQKNHNLVLSDEARADTIPELEILTNEVACSHAAAVSPIDEEQVFFCTSRGLSPDEARRAIVLGFLEPTVARIPGDLLLARVREALDARLGGTAR